MKYQVSQQNLFMFLQYKIDVEIKIIYQCIIFIGKIIKYIFLLSNNNFILNQSLYQGISLSLN